MLLPVILGALAFGPYQDIPIEGFTVRVEQAEVRDPSWKSVRAELGTQLYRISHVVPDGPLAKLRKVVIWVHRDDAATRCMAYHPAPEWLKEHGSNPAMAHGVEIANAANFVSWTYEQPWMVLHELAHAYHHQFLEKGFENKQVKDVWDSAMAAKRYDSVLHWDGSQSKHYAETNPMEFFAETTESYFGQNDFYPFVNSELKTFDPDAFKLMQNVWGAPQKRT
jgi:hypothetical protein